MSERENIPEAENYLTDVRDHTPIQSMPYVVSGSRLCAQVSWLYGVRLVTATEVDDEATARARSYMGDLPINRENALRLAVWMLENYPE